MAFGNGTGYTAKVEASASTGTVSSVDLSAPSSLFNVSGTPITVSGTIALSLKPQPALQVFASPNTGIGGIPLFRSLVAADIPSLPYGSVTSVAMSVPSIFSIAGSPITTSGTLAIALANQTANKVFASPNGSTGAPTFRALVAEDLPSGAFWLVGGNSIAGASAFMGITNSKNLAIGTDLVFAPHFNLYPTAILCGKQLSHYINPAFSSLYFSDRGVEARRDLADNYPAFVVQQNGGLLNIAEYNFNGVKKAELSVTGTYKPTNYLTGSGTPAITLNTGAGTGATFTIVGNNNAGKIIVNVGTGAVAFTDLFKLTPSSFVAPNGFSMVLIAENTATATFLQTYTTNGTSAFISATVGGVAPSSGTVLSFKYYIYAY